MRYITKSQTKAIAAGKPKPSAKPSEKPSGGKSK